MKEAPKVEIKDKILLTIEEAAAYSGISATVLEIEQERVIMILSLKTERRL